MRLIIVDDSIIALDGIVDLLLKEHVVELKDIVCIKCGSTEAGEIRSKVSCIKKADSCEDVVNKLEELCLKDNEVVLFDVGLFGEKEERMHFTEFGSVKCAEYLRKNYSGVVCKFYTVIYGATRLDFARETNYKWGEPLLRPIFTDTAEETNKKQKLVREIKKLLLKK